MNCLIMAGGLGSRIGTSEKALLTAGGITLADRIIQCLSGICDETYAAIDPSMERLKRYLSDRGIRIIERKRAGYISDLDNAINIIGDFPILVVPGDIYISDCRSFREDVLHASSIRSNVVSMTYGGAFSGLSIFNGPSGSFSNYAMKTRIVNINTQADLDQIRG